jgi:O-antigen ligase
VIRVAIIVAIAWGVFAFGAVYPWAYAPLLVVCCLAGVATLATGTRGRPPIKGVVVGLVGIAAAMTIQLLPIPRGVLVAISPGTDAFMREYSLEYSAPPDVTVENPREPPAHALSIEPGQTLVALALFSCLALFMFACARASSVQSARPFVLALASIGGVLAIAGMVQEALAPRDVGVLIYGFWKPQFWGSRAFGPFVNRNHFAGWMLMAIPVVLGMFNGLLEQLSEGANRRTRRFFETLSGPGGRIPLSLAATAVLMAISLLMTRSRSGIAAFGLQLALIVVMLLRRTASRRVRLTITTVAALFAIGVVAAAGPEALARFQQEDANAEAVGGRLGIWRDAGRIISDFPVAGTGLNTFGIATIVYQRGGRALHFEQAHNDYLQLAAEGGLLVGVPVLLTAFLFASAVRARFREAPKNGVTYWIRVGAVIGLLSILAQSAVEFSLQMPGNAALFALLAGIALHRSPNVRVRNTPENFNHGYPSNS